jgi:glycolate oxidase FAD binding subunit
MDAIRETGRDEFTPTTASELARFVAENARGARRALHPVGGRTALHSGAPLSRDALAIATSRLTRTVDYPARDMTITVEAGIRVEELQELLGRERQRLAVDVAQAHRATLGGAIATNTSGPARFGLGTFRDYVIGISAIDGQGRLFSAGGRVVKNVAGYDLCKLLTGSHGTLACITQVTLKLKPAPETRRLLWATFTDLLAIDAVLERLTNSQSRPIAMEVLNARAAWQLQAETSQTVPAASPVLILAFEGMEREALWQVETARNELAEFRPGEMLTLDPEDSEAMYAALVEYQAASDDPLTFQATLPLSRTAEFLAVANASEIAVQAHAGNGIVIGHLPDWCTDGPAAARLVGPLRKHAERHGGALVVLNCDAGWKQHVAVFGTPRGDAAIMRGIKQVLDPHNVWNPGRLEWSPEGS